MKSFLVVAFVLLMTLIVVNRQRVYVRDPLATVYKSDVKQAGVQVFINYSNDVLLWQDAEPGAYRILVQRWNEVPGNPMVLKCLRWMACLADADRALSYPIGWTGNSGKGKGKYDPKVSMTSREVSFVDGDGAAVRVELR